MFWRARSFLPLSLLLPVTCLGIYGSLKEGVLAGTGKRAATPEWAPVAVFSDTETVAWIWGPQTARDGVGCMPGECLSALVLSRVLLLL